MLFESLGVMTIILFLFVLYQCYRGCKLVGLCLGKFHAIGIFFLTVTSVTAIGFILSQVYWFVNPYDIEFSDTFSLLWQSVSVITALVHMLYTSSLNAWLSIMKETRRISDIKNLQMLSRRRRLKKIRPKTLHPLK